MNITLHDLFGNKDSNDNYIMNTDISHQFFVPLYPKTYIVEQIRKIDAKFAESWSMAGLVDSKHKKLLYICCYNCKSYDNDGQLYIIGVSSNALRIQFALGKLSIKIHKDKAILISGSNKHAFQSMLKNNSVLIPWRYAVSKGINDNIHRNSIVNLSFIKNEYDKASEYNTIGNKLLLEEQYFKAINVYQKAIEVGLSNMTSNNDKWEQDLGIFYSNLGKTYLKLNMYDLAITACDNSIKFNDQLSTSYQHRAIAYSFIKKSDDKTVKRSSSIIFV